MQVLYCFTPTGSCCQEKNTLLSTRSWKQVWSLHLWASCRSRTVLPSSLRLPGLSPTSPRAPQNKHGPWWRREPFQPSSASSHLLTLTSASKLSGPSAISLVRRRSSKHFTDAVSVWVWVCFPFKVMARRTGTKSSNTEPSSPCSHSCLFPTCLCLL